MSNIESDLTGRESRAIEDAASAFADSGIEFSMPWNGDLDDLERERFDALIRACRAYALRMAADLAKG